MRVEVIRAWVGEYHSVSIELPDGATAAQALQAIGSHFQTDGISAMAVFGQAADASTVLQDGDRLELLRPLLADPKDARRIRARRALRRVAGKPES